MAEKLFINENQVAYYAKGRPRYPASLFEKLASLTSSHERAWDVGTGNGQCAIMVAKHYKSVIATDVSEPQLARAFKSPNVTYSATSAKVSIEELERVVGPEGSVDLITVATALHYLDLDSFYQCAKHVLRNPGGILAAWTYWGPVISPEIDEFTSKAVEMTKQYQAEKAVFAFEGYRTIPFPFEPVNREMKEHHEGGGKVDVEVLDIEIPMTVDDYINLVKSYSFIQNALEAGVDVLDEAKKQAIFKTWGGADHVRVARFPIHLLIGTVPAEPTN